jgi:hypothetical protein
VWSQRQAIIPPAVAGTMRASSAFRENVMTKIRAKPGKPVQTTSNYDAMIETSCSTGFAAEEKAQSRRAVCFY